jgi:hypothetical protein
MTAQSLGSCTVSTLSDRHFDVTLGVLSGSLDVRLDVALTSL